jgi:hypothetical protein
VITDHGKRDQAPIRTARTPAEKAKEKVEEKQIIFAELDRLAPPDALLVSSTSALVASRFTETLPGRARCLVGHPVNPPHLIPLVELCGAPWMSPHQPTPERIAALTQQRNERLAALAAHKSSPLPARFSARGERPGVGVLAAHAGARSSPSLGLPHKGEGTDRVGTKATDHQASTPEKESKP